MKWHDYPMFYTAAAKAKGWKLTKENAEQFCQKLVSCFINPHIKRDSVCDESLALAQTQLIPRVRDWQI